MTCSVTIKNNGPQQYTVKATTYGQGEHNKSTLLAMNEELTETIWQGKGFIVEEVSEKIADCESAGEFLERVGTDGMKWAVEFNKLHPTVSVDDVLGWCCNMIEAGRTAGHKTGFTAGYADACTPKTL